MGKYIIATNTEGCIFGNYFTEVFTDETTAEETLARVRKSDPNAKLLLVIEKGGEGINGGKENSC